MFTSKSSEIAYDVCHRGSSKNYVFDITNKDYVAYIIHKGHGLSNSILKEATIDIWANQSKHACS